MIVGKAIYYLLTNATGVTDIVSTRIYPEVAQQDAALPYIVYNVANNEPTDTKPEPSKLDTAQVEVNIYSDSYTEAIDLAVAVRAALDRVKGTYNGVNVQSIQYLNEIIDFDEPQRAYNINADYDVRISRSDFEIAQGSPITGVELGELSDVNVSGATDNQVLSYDAASDTWIPADDAGGAEQLNDLSDVNIVVPSEDEFLKYDGAEWINDALSISQVQGLQAALDATPDALDDLTDVKIVGTPADGDALVYSSGFWARGTAGASTLGDLSDVNLTTPSTGAYLQFDGAEWIDSVITLPSVPSTYYHNRYATEAETLRSGATETVELYYTAQADGDGYAESASSDTASAGNVIRRKLYYSEAAQADPDTGTWVQFADIADDTTFASAKATLLAYLKERTGGTVPISLKMTWEDVAGASLLLDTYTGAAAAYSLRQLRTAYTGDAIRVRRASDNTEQDIGFDGSGELDTTSLASFCSGTDGFVKVWYDQASTNDATQTTTANQPKIYDSVTGVVTENGKPAVQGGIMGTPSISWNGTNSGYFIVNNQPYGQFVWVLGNNASNRHSLQLQRFGNIDWVSSATTQTIATSAVTMGQQNLIYAMCNASKSDARVNGSDFADTAAYPAGSDTINSLFNGRFTNTVGNTKFQEIIYYPSDQSTNVTNIEDNINTFYSIY